MTDAPLPERRDAIVAQLGAAWAAESIDEAEFDRRMSAAFAARDPGELERLVADLPMPGGMVPVQRGASFVSARTGASLAPLRRVVLGSVDERVRGLVPAQVEYGVRLGSMELDFSDAVFTSAYTEIVLDVLLGNVEIVLPRDIAVEMRVDGMLGSVEYRDHGAAASPSARTVRFTGRCVLGSIEVDSGAKRH